MLNKSAINKLTDWPQMSLQEKSIKKLHKKMEKMERILEQKQEEINALFSEKKTSEEESMLKNDQQRSEALQLKRKLEESKEECELVRSLTGWHY